MSTRRHTFQYKEIISINREQFTEVVVKNNVLTKKDLRVLNQLMTHLDGMNYRAISKRQIACELNMKKKHVSRSIENLLDYMIIAEGSSVSVEKGYKLLF